MALGTVILPFDIGSYGQPNKCILSGITDPNVAGSYGMVAGDQFNLILYPRVQPASLGGSTTTQQLPAGSSITVTGKPATTPGAGSVLFLADTFAESNDAAGNTGNWLYTGVLNLNTTELLAAIPPNQPSIQVTLVIEINEESGGEQRFLANITINNPTYTGTEGSPSAATPGYLTGAQIAAAFIPQAPPQGSFRMKVEEDGTANLQFYNATTGLFHTYYPLGAPGAIEGNWGPGEA